MVSNNNENKSNDRTLGRRKGDFQVREQNFRYEKLLKLGQSIISEMNMLDLFESIIDETNKIMMTQRSTVFLYDNKTCELWSMVATGIGKGEIRIRSDYGVAGWVFKKRTIAIINDAYNDSRFYGMIDQKSGFVTRNIICAPLIDRKGCAIGVLQSLNKLTDDFIEDDERIFISIANYVAIALENSRLYENLKEYANRLEEMVSERTKELHQTQAKLIETEKRTLEHRITGGFAHEMRNALSGAQLEFKTTLNYKNQDKSATVILKDSATILLKNISRMHEEYGIPREKIAILFLPQLKTIAEIADHLSEVHTGVSSDLDRGLSITSQIREYARMSEFKKGEEPIDVVSLLKEYENRYKQDFERIGITYSVEGLETAVVKADETHMNSIFSNLILNARDALEEQDAEGKAISVKVERVDEAGVKLLKIKIEDNGPGIPEEQINEIFEPFFSTKPTTGTGLGLGIVKRLVQLYDGKIELISKEGAGTVFSVVLPYEI